MPVTQVYTATQILNVVFGRVYDQDNVYAHPARNIDTVEFETQLNSQSGALVVVLRIQYVYTRLIIFCACSITMIRARSKRRTKTR